MLREYNMSTNWIPRQLITFPLAVCIFVLLISSMAYLQTSKPFSKQSIIATLKLGMLSNKELIRQIQQRGVDFKLTNEVETELREAGAYPEVIDTVRGSYRATSQPAVTPDPAPSNSPLSKSEIITMLQGGQQATAVEQMVGVRGVDFLLTPEIGDEITKVGGTRVLLGAISEGFKKAGLTYEDLLDLAGVSLAEKNGGNKAIDLLQQAVKLAPARPEAYSSLGFVRLHLQHMLKGRDRKAERAAGEQNMREALERNGEVLFPMEHIHPSLITSCSGFLIVRRSSVAYQPLIRYIKSADDSFDVSDANVKQVGLGGLLGKGNSERFAIHVVRADGNEKNYLFAIKRLDTFFSSRYPQFIKSVIEDYK